MNALPKTALVVEDDEATAELETRVLHRMGMRVFAASTSGDAILALNSQLFSIVLLDHKLPDGASWPVLEAALNSSVRIPVIIVTAMGDERVAAEAIHRGAADYLVKSGNFWEQFPLLIERAIKLSEAERAMAHLASIVKFSPDATVSITPDGTIQSWNAAATLMYGYSNEEAVGANISILSAVGISCDFQEILARLNRGEFVGNIETVRTGAEGRETDLFLAISPIKDARAKVIGLCIIAHDFTERRARRVAEEANKAKSAFLANMSHEIRTPMNAIIGFNYLMQQTLMTVRQSEYAAKIGAAAHGLLGLLNDILDLSKVEAGKIELEQAEFDLEEVLSKLVQLTSSLVRQKSLAFKVDIAADARLRLIGDSLRLEQVLLNLSSNAIKFTEAGEILACVELQERTDSGVTLKFKVQDKGIGMRPSQIQTLFQPFVQGDSTTTRKHGGTGLGLAISKQLVKLMNGEFEVESKPGVGSIFSFTARFGEPVRQKAQSISQRARDKQRALLICSMAAARMQLAKILGDLNFSVTSRATCEESLVEIARGGSARPNDFDVLLIDGSQSGEDWQTGVKRIRGEFSDRTCPKIILVADERMSDQRMDFNAVGIDGIVFPPLSRSPVYDAIARAQSKRVGVLQASNVQGAAGNTLRGARILLVEDEEINRQVATEVLGMAGCEVTAACNGPEALSIIFEMTAERKYHAVLMDLHMPGMDGITVARHVRSEKRFADLPIIAMTADAIQGVQESCLEAGMDGYLTKPINPDELFATLGRWVPAQGQ